MNGAKNQLITMLTMLMRNGMVSEIRKKKNILKTNNLTNLFFKDADESGAEIAELEEKEALAIQQRMAQQLEDADFGLDFITHLKVLNMAHFFFKTFQNYLMFWQYRKLTKLRKQNLLKKRKLMSIYPN